MDIPGFTAESLDAVTTMLYAEGQKNPYEGKCDQKKLREQNKTQRTQAQQAADRERAQANRGKDKIPSATRSQAAKKAAETRRRCKGLTSGPSTPPTTTV